MTDDWDLIGYIISSKYRALVLKQLSKGPSTPSQISEETGQEIASISHSLTKLRNRDCVELLVPEDRRKGRVYRLTDKGQEILEHMEAEQLLEGDQLPED